MNLTTVEKTRIATVALDVRRSSMMGLATTYGATVSGQDGGYAVPADVAKSIFMPQTDALLPLCTGLPVSVGGSIDVPFDFATPYSNGGIVAAWENEAAELPQQKPKLNMAQFRMKKLIALVPLSDELLDDSDALAAYLPLALQTAVTIKVNEAIISGPGTGRVLGILNSGSLITVPKVGSQPADTIVDVNVQDMLDRSLTPMQSTWVANTAAYSQITQLSSFHSATRTLAGLPIVLTDSCPARGTGGDLILADLSKYIVASKTPQLNGSAHFWYDQDITAFKLIFRMDGMPILAAPITPPNSSTTKSHFVALGTRG